jgi:acyl-CoA thioester hydrolase
MGITWHGHYVKYFEIARCALLDTFDYSYRQMHESGYSWPVIELKLRYARPATLGQRIKVRAWIAEYEMRLKIGYLVSDAETGKRLIRGHTVQVAVDMKTNELLLNSPPVLYHKLGRVPCD